MTLRLLIHALGLIARNALHAFKIVLLPGLAYFLASVLFGSLGTSGGLIMGFVSLVIGAWIGTNWFPFILRERYPGWVPPFEGPLIAAYIAAYFPIVLTNWVISYAQRLIGAEFGMGLFNMGVPVTLAFSVIPFVVGVLGFYVYLRLGLALPAAALGRTGDVMASWQETRRLSTPILVISALVGVADILLAHLLSNLGVLGSLLSVVWQVVHLLLPLALVTSLYGVLIEGRRL